MSSVAVTATVVDALEACGIDYMLVGAFSSNAYGIARATNDADFVVAIKSGQLHALMQELGAEFALDAQLQIEGLTGSVRNVITHLRTNFQIDLFRLNTKDEHHDERFRRRRRQVLSDIRREAWIPAVEDVVIQKIRWGRRKDLDDVVNILAVSGMGIDWSYLRKWTEKHGTQQQLRKLCDEVPNLMVPEQFQRDENEPL